MTARFLRSSILLLLVYMQLTSTVLANDSYNELYVKFHISADRAYDAQQQATNLSDNSSRFGLQGRHKTNAAYSFVWLIENKVYVDESGGRLGNPVYGGFESKMGRVLAGFIDTPYKSFVSKFNVMDDTVADIRSIMGYNGLGSDAVGNLNVRARNALLYENKLNAYLVSVLFSAENGDEGTTTGLDDNSRSGYSARAEYEQKHFNVGVATEKWKGAKALQGIRIGGRYQRKPYQFGMILERMNSAVDARYRHDAYAFDIGFTPSNKSQIKLQMISATADKELPASGARMYSIGEYFKVDKELSYYAIGAKLTNDINAKYQLGSSGHGDIINPAFGGEIWAVSFGVVYRITASL